MRKSTRWPAIQAWGTMRSFIQASLGTTKVSSPESEKTCAASISSRARADSDRRRIATRSISSLRRADSMIASARSYG